MTRNRSSSVVSKIAHNVPILEQFEQLSNSQSLDSMNKTTHQRSNSFTSVSSFNTLQKKTTLDQYSIITPLTDSEKTLIWSKQQELNENNIGFELPDEIIIEDLESNINNEMSIFNSKQFQDFLLETKSQNDVFIADVENIISKLESLLEIHNNVTVQTRDFQSESITLIDELNSFEKLLTDLQSKFVIFQDLESIVKRLNTANNSKIVLKSSFHNNILLKLDVCLKAVNDPSYSKYKDIDSYKYRFKQCMIRALTLIRNFLINYLKSVESKLITQIDEIPKDTEIANNKNKTSVLIDALINKNFVDNLDSFFNLFIEIYKRSYSNDDYFNLLDDIYNQYFKTRGFLVKTYIIHQFTSNVDFNTDLINLANSNLKFFTKLIEKEFEIFKNLFFLPPTEITENTDNSANLTAAHKFFESLLDPLYYLLRNKILRETKINSLCELINLIKSYTEIENDPIGFSEILDMQQLSKIDYEELFQPILEDAQTRLVFRIHKYVETNIVNYKKTGKELIISNKPTSTVNGDNENDDLIDNNLLLNSTLIYPPIIDSIKLLTKIYQLLKQSIFDDITSSVVHLSLLSLENNFNNNSTIDCKLYEIRSLILFKDYINSFEIEHARKETTLDFSGLRKLYAKFLGRKDKIELKSTDHESLFNLILGSIPKVVNDYVDCRIELQIELRNIVHEFIKITSKKFIEPLYSVPLDSLTVANLKTINENLLNNIKTELPRLKALIKDYIRDTKTSTFLLDGIQEEMQNEYTTFYNNVNELGKGDIIAELLEVEFLNKTWADTVKLLFLDDENEEDNDMADLKDIQKDIDAIVDDPLDVETNSSIVTTNI